MQKGAATRNEATVRRGSTSSPTRKSNSRARFRCARDRTTPITPLADGASGEYTFEVAVGSANWDLIRWVVIADYQPIGADYPFDTLQAVMGP